MTDVLEKRVSPVAAQAVCAAGRNIGSMVALRLKYGSTGDSGEDGLSLT